MSTVLTQDDIHRLAAENGYEYSSLRSVIAVESGGKGFDSITGKILIQFEPAWFKRKEPYTPSGCWSLNKVENQKEEWKAFTNAYGFHPEAAMESTSIGMMQVMGFHWKLLGFESVGAMWDYAKVNEANQVEIGIRFIKSNRKLDTALKKKLWGLFAYYYNGPQYRKFQYHIKLAKFDKVFMQTA